MEHTRSGDTAHTAFRLPTDLIAKLDQLAEAEDRSRAWIVRALLLEAIAARESGTS